MKPVQSYPVEPKYKRANGLIVLDTDNLPLPKDFKLRETSVVRLPAGEVAGNHKHPRQEAYFCLDEGVELHWFDEAGQVHTEKMATTDVPRLFIVPPLVPHAVVNISGRAVTLLGYADGALEDVEPVAVVVLKPQPSSGLSGPEIVQTSELLSRLKPGFLPFAIFHEVARLVAVPIVELVPLRKNAQGQIEVLLLAREPDDPVWPGMLHVPGTVVRATDTPNSFDDAFKRILVDELGGTLNLQPIFVKIMLHQQARGMEVSQVFWVELDGNPAKGQFFNANNLPETIVATQRGFIADAVEHFRGAKVDI